MIVCCALQEAGITLWHGKEVVASRSNALMQISARKRGSVSPQYTFVTYLIEIHLPPFKIFFGTRTVVALARHTWLRYLQNRPSSRLVGFELPSYSSVNQQPNRTTRILLSLGGCDVIVLIFHFGGMGAKRCIFSKASSYNYSGCIYPWGWADL